MTKNYIIVDEKFVEDDFEKHSFKLNGSYLKNKVYFV